MCPTNWMLKDAGDGEDAMSGWCEEVANIGGLVRAYPVATIAVGRYNYYKVGGAIGAQWNLEGVTIMVWLPGTTITTRVMVILRSVGGGSQWQGLDCRAGCSTGLL